MPRDPVNNALFTPPGPEASFTVIGEAAISIPAGVKIVMAPHLKSTCVMHRGFLLAVAESCRSFGSWGDDFHQAYRLAMQSVKCDATREALESIDLVFGVYTEAEAMILEGMRDLILWLDGPALHTARFKVSAERAKKELDTMKYAPVYRHMAAVFVEHAPHRVR